MKKKHRFILLMIPLSIFFLFGCSKEVIETNKQTIEGEGLTYDLQLPRGWKKQANYQTIYGRQSAFGAEDTKSKSGMSVLLFPKEGVDQKGFGERTRKELAEKNNYKKVDGVYLKEYTINEAPAYKFTFETRFGDQKVWSHFYAIFTKNGVIEVMFYSAQDTAYKERAKLIDASMDTVKEIAYDEVANSAKDEENSDKIEVENNELSAVITGIRTISGKHEEKIFVLRYQLTNLSDQVIKPVEWQTFIELKQQGVLLEKATLPESTTSFDTKELVDAGEKELNKGESVESVLLYRLPEIVNIQLTFDSTHFPRQKTYTLLLSNKEEKNNE
ncbi:hypothetical protein UAY_00131 [Enterococcus moraviensis ATCC BAA-383]|uniref:DUF5067 domain-containing protein n=1 Tax=Enterococcus moraviensis ATCC BAA-383 TaxID=1158609 RepID=R2TNK9_9ENTE|nr:DUF5067 domain-containing protein [Enterococcus moraviensis]EOI06789.1 hypothetical protein UAY_00131 [Enterococcus moraviensis ATCC BAA-383]EOT65126.1 hypothetical protein I586_02860 [Enterococcus moraviensis ATCC BAA-383]OJG66971.1 hypothetical protein RV09_GL003188 [Enterococcus moraviensis]